MTRAERIASAVERWFRDNERALPWRVRTRGKRSPYFALVSEAMLQQTQASRIAERFGAFIERFPDLEALARASDDEILSAWDGLGYYRRARHLRDAARVVLEDHSGRVPRDVNALRTLPGVGAYSAGSIASIAFEERAAIVDANVERVVLRVEGKRLRKGSKEAAALAWEKAEELVRAAESPGRFNEGLMELGGLVCTPKSPKCGVCPLSRLCVARREGTAVTIPLPKAAPTKSDLHFGVVVVHDARGRVLLEQRPDAGLWRRMWQAPTVERTDRAVRRAEAARHVGLPSAALCKCVRFAHTTSHRALVVDVWTSEAAPAVERDGLRRWASAEETAALAMGAAQRRALLEALETIH